MWTASVREVTIVQAIDDRVTWRGQRKGQECHRELEDSNKQSETTMLITLTNEAVSA